MFHCHVAECCFSGCSSPLITRDSVSVSVATALMGKKPSSFQSLSWCRHGYYPNALAPHESCWGKRLVPHWIDESFACCRDALFWKQHLQCCWQAARFAAAISISLYQHAENSNVSGVIDSSLSGYSELLTQESVCHPIQMLGISASWRDMPLLLSSSCTTKESADSLKSCQTLSLLLINTRESQNYKTPHTAGPL